MKTAVILSGGGMTGAYCVGALLKLKDQGIDPDIIIAGSGSAGTASYFIAGQFASIEHIWVNLLPTRKFINFFRISKVLDIDYLIDNVFKKQEPLHNDKIKNSKTVYLIPVTNLETGEIHYLSNRSDSFDVYESMRATMSFPILYKKSVRINGMDYSDGLFSASAYFHINKARELGGDMIFVIDSNIRTNKLLYRVFLLFMTREFRKRHLTYLKIKYENKTHDGVVVIRSKRLHSGLLNNRRAFIQKLIEEGRKM